LRNYDAARDVARLRRLVWMVAGVGVLWCVVGQPSSWNWLTNANRHDAHKGGGSTSRSLVETPAESPLPVGAVRILPAAADPPPRVAGDEKLQKVGGFVVEVPRTALDGIRHDYQGLRVSEAAALDLFLDRVRATPLNVLEQAAASEFSYAELTHDPERYSGRIATFRGWVRQCRPLTLRRADGSPQELYEAWLFTESGGRRNPYRVLCDALPKGFPVATDMRVEVGVTGYFFKRYGYATTHGPHAAPMFVVKRVRWSPPIDGELARNVSWAGRVAASFFALLAVAFSLAAWKWAGLNRSRVSTRRPHRVADVPPVGLDPREIPTEISAEEFLRRLSENSERNGREPSPSV
jgi:hypothetical protein